MNPMERRRGLRSLIAASACTIALGLSLGPAAHASGLIGDFRVLPYQQDPALDGMLFTWFTIEEIPGEISITGPGLDKPLVLASTPELDVVLDYQAAAELSAGGEFPKFATVRRLTRRPCAAPRWPAESALSSWLACSAGRPRPAARLAERW